MARKAVAPALLALFAASGLLGTAAAAPAGAASCPNMDMPSAQLTLDQFNDSMFCIVNRTRPTTAIRTPRPRSGRLREIGYIRRGYVLIVGEDLRWSTPETSTPADILQMWLNSLKQRMYLLKPKFDELGVIGRRGTPLDPNLPRRHHGRGGVRLPENEMTDCFPHLAGSSVAVRGGCLARHTPWLYFWLRRPRQNRRSDQGIGSQEPIRIGPPENLRPLSLTHTTQNST
jgi:hypothetical protein